MSNRFHNKYHRHNHHTDSINDPRFPDASHDPIASPESPFLGNFVMFGTLSAVQERFPDFAGSFVNTVNGIALNVESFTTAISARGDVLIAGNLYAQSLNLIGPVYTSFSEPVTASNQFLLVTVRDTNSGITYNRAIRLWEYIA